MRTLVLGSVLVLLLAFTAVGQQGGQKKARKSPHETTTATIGGQTITIEYGRPYMRGRKIFGELVPFGQVWRTGADEATTLTTPVDLMIGNIKVPAGSYGLFTLPDQSGWKLIVNKVPKQWGAFKYEESQDLGRTDMKVEKTGSPVEQLTISLDPAGRNAGTLKIAWENTVASVPVKLAK